MDPLPLIDGELNRQIHRLQGVNFYQLTYSTLLFEKF